MFQFGSLVKKSISSKILIKSLMEKRIQGFGFVLKRSFSDELDKPTEQLSDSSVKVVEQLKKSFKGPDLIDMIFPVIDSTSPDVIGMSISN